MNTGDGLIRGTAWAALGLYLASEAVVACRRGTASKPARWLNSLGCAAMLAHILVSFHFRHGWSHDAAYADTARQTAALTGWNWGGGLYVNYLFALVWAGQVVSSWTARAHAASSIGLPNYILRGIFLFMFLNAGVIFVRGPARWVGLACCLGLAALWLWPRRLMALASPRPCRAAEFRRRSRTKT